ncbi:MAG: HIT domain-containing protein [Ignavibacteriae bacterium]|nr:HIT domain-containing protein [Ignavibacteriota bacterium]
MNRLFSPWRSKYIESFSEPKKNSDECILCEAYQANNDDERLIVTRGQHCFVIMNLYPYNSGHLMIVPYKHTSDFSELSDEESLEIMSLLKKMMNALKQISNPDGFNIGSNLGKVAGAGIDQHIHFHIVPRWNGDTNFMPVLADTKLISEDMRETLRKLRNTL